MKNAYKIKIQSFTRAHLSRGAGESGAGPVTAALRATSTAINNDNNNNKIIHTILYILLFLLLLLLLRTNRTAGTGIRKLGETTIARDGTEKKIPAR